MSTKIFLLPYKRRLMHFVLLSVLLHAAVIFIMPQINVDKKKPLKLIPIELIEPLQPPETRDAEPDGVSRETERIRRPPPVLRQQRRDSSLRGERGSTEQRPMPMEPPPVPEEVKKGTLAVGPQPGSEGAKRAPLVAESTPAPEAIVNEAGMQDKEEGPLESVPIPLKKEDKPIILIPARERLAELAERYEKETPVSEKDKRLSFDTGEPRYVTYLEGLKAKIYHKWEYPYTAARLGQSGKLFIRFTILRGGYLEEVTLIKSSMYPMLDDAALSAIRMAAPFYPFPKEFGSLERITINASFEYILEKIPYEMRGK